MLTIKAIGPIFLTADTWDPSPNLQKGWGLGEIKGGDSLEEKSYVAVFRKQKCFQM